MRKLMILLATATMVTACEKEPNSNKNQLFKLNSNGSMTINVNVKNPSDYSNVTKVKAEIVQVSLGGSSVTTIAEANWNGGKFSITLPAKVESNLLKDGYYLEDIAVKQCEVSLRLYDADDNLVVDNFGHTYLKRDDETLLLTEVATTVWHYMDNNYTIIGDDAAPFDYRTGHYNLKFKKGWNVSYIKAIYEIIDDGNGGKTTSMHFDFYSTSSKPDLAFEWQPFVR